MSDHVLIVNSKVLERRRLAQRVLDANKRSRRYRCRMKIKTASIVHVALDACRIRPLSNRFRRIAVFANQRTFRTFC
jgi:hypothetical protein